MFHQLAEAFTPLMQTYGALGVFLASIIEEIIAPIPSSIVVLSSGFFLTEGMAAGEAAIVVALKVMLPASLGITIGSLFPYYIARFGGEIAIGKLGWLLGVKIDDLRRAEAWFKKGRSDEILLFAVRAIPIVPSVIIGLFCGIIRMPVKEFLFYSFIGSLPRTFFLGMLGWSAGAAYLRFADKISLGENLILGICVVGGVIFFGLLLGKALKRKKT